MANIQVALKKEQNLRCRRLRQGIPWVPANEVAALNAPRFGHPPVVRLANRHHGFSDGDGPARWGKAFSDARPAAAPVNLEGPLRKNAAKAWKGGLRFRRVLGRGGMGLVALFQAPSLVTANTFHKCVIKMSLKVGEDLLGEKSVLKVSSETDLASSHQPRWRGEARPPRRQGTVPLTLRLANETRCSCRADQIP